jgi:hypothetical protein
MLCTLHVDRRVLSTQAQFGFGLPWGRRAAASCLVLEHHQISSLHCCLFACCREEREQRRADIEHLASSLVNKVNECVGAIDEGEYSTGGAVVAHRKAASLGRL